VDGVCLDLGRACQSAALDPVRLGETLTGDRRRGGTNFAAECARTTLSPEQVVRIDLRDETDLVVTVVTDGFTPVLTLLDDCGEPLRSVCAALDGPTGHFEPGPLAAGTWYLVVDGLDAEPRATGHFRLLARARPDGPLPGGETCEAATPIPIEAGFTTVSGKATGGETTCGAEAAGATFSFRLDEPARVSAHLLGATWGTAASVELLVGGCGAEAITTGCLPRPGERLSRAGLPAGDHALVVRANTAWAIGLRIDPPGLPAANDVCEAAPLLALDDTHRARVSGDLSLATPTLVAACAETPGPDLAWRARVPAGRRLEARVEPGDAWAPLLSVTTGCGAEAEELACADVDARASVPPAAADRELVLVVDTADPVGGPFELVVDVIRDDEPGTCAAPLPLLPGDDGVLRTRGNTTGRADGQPRACGEPTPGPDLVYTFDLQEPAGLLATVEAPAGWEATISLQAEVCAGGIDVACAAGEALRSRTTLSAAALDPGRYFLVVDGCCPGAEGEFSLTVELSEALANDACDEPATVEVDAADGSASLTGNLALASDTERLACAPDAELPDRHWLLELEQPAAVRVRAVEDGPASPLYVALLPQGCDVGPPVGCALLLPGHGSLFVPELPAGGWRLAVEGLADADFALSVELGPSPAVPDNDRCEGAVALEFEAGAVVTEGHLGAATDGQAGSCAPDGAAEAIYGISVVAPVSLWVTRLPDPGDADLFVWARRSVCDSLDAEEGCRPLPRALGPDDRRLVAPRLEPLTVYYLGVEARATDAAHRLRWTLELPHEPPEHDRCDAALPIVVPAEDDPAPIVLQGDTTEALDNYRASCAAGAFGPDLVYELDLDRPYTLAAHLEAEGAWDSALHLRARACDNPEAERACNDDDGRVGASALDLPYLATGRWYLFVDGLSGAAAGPFSLEVDLGEALRCPDAEVIEVAAVPDPLPLVFAGTTTGEPDDVTASCGARAPGPDRLHVLETSLEYRLDARLDTPGWDGVLHVRGEPCSDPAAEVGCNDDEPEVGRAALTVDRLPAGRWHVFVDGYAADATGDYELTVTLSAGGDDG